MSLLYSGYLTDIGNGTSITKSIMAGSIALTLEFLWDTANQEQYEIIARALQAKAESDSLLKGTEIRRDYDWIDWYLALPDTINSLIAYLDEGGEYPQSIRNLENRRKAEELLSRKNEAKDLQKLIQPMIDQLVWNVRVTDDEGFEVTGIVQAGGWLNNQGNRWSIRFDTELQKVGFDDLSKVEIVVEDKTA